MAIDKVQRTSRRQFVSQTRGRAISVDTGKGDDRFQILSQLGKFAQAGTAEASRKMQAEIETKKALGASRAAQDLLKTEQNRQGVTDDDVNATKVAYNAILGKHDTMEAGNSFSEWYQQNPEADEDDIADKKAELYQPIFEKYSGDKQSLKQVSLDVQESQFSLLHVEEKIKTQHQRFKSEEALTMSIGDLLADPNADVSTIVGDEIPIRSKELGLDEPTYKKALMSEMVIRAESGDSRLLEVMKQTDWAKNSVLIQKSQNSYDQFRSREDAVSIGDELGSLEIENSQLTVPWATTLRKIDNLNARYPNAISKERVASMKKSRESAVRTEANNTDMMELSYKNLFDENGLPLAMNGKYSPEDKKKFIKQLDSVFATKTQEMIDSGVPEDEANNLMMKQRLDFSRVNRIKITLLEENLQGLLSLNPDDFPSSEDLPSYATKAMSMLQQMDASTVELYLPSRDDKVYAANIQSSLRNREPFAALKRANKIKVSPYKFDSTKKSEIEDAVKYELDKELDKSMFAKLFGAKDVPDYQRAQIYSIANEESMLNAYNGMLDSETNAKQTAAVVMQDYSQTFNGTLINIPKAKLAQDTGIPVVKVDSYLEKFVLSNSDFISKETGFTDGVDADDITIDFAGNGTFRMLYKGSEQIGGKFLYSDIKSIGDRVSSEEVASLREAGIEKKRKEVKQEEYDAADETASEAIFYSRGY